VEELCLTPEIYDQIRIARRKFEKLAICYLQFEVQNGHVRTTFTGTGTDQLSCCIIIADNDEKHQEQESAEWNFQNIRNSHTTILQCLVLS